MCTRTSTDRDKTNKTEIPWTTIKDISTSVKKKARQMCQEYFVCMRVKVDNTSTYMYVRTYVHVHKLSTIIHYVSSR
eukprot:m.38383 g.38383  ORF g.38383 m.38383 type:complete len:77 (+) comp17905_c0_seq1:174-404(+)